MVETSNMSLDINPEYFSPMRYVDRKFKESMAGQDIRDSKGHKVGKILGSSFNSGTVLVDIPRLYNNGIDAKYFLEDKLIMMW